MLIGTGKTIRLASKELVGSEVYVATARDALPPSLGNAKVIGRQAIRRFAKGCEMIVSATKHSGYLLDKADLSDGRRRVVVDLAFPRNINPDVGYLSSTTLLDLDDLAIEAASRYRELGESVREARRFVKREASEFQASLLASRLTPLLSSLYQWGEGLRRSELERALNRLPNLSERERLVVAALSKRIVSKILARPTLFARASRESTPQQERLTLVRRVFRLED